MIIAAVSRKQQILESISQFLSEFDRSDQFSQDSNQEQPYTLISINGGMQQAVAVAEQERPDLLLLESSEDETNDLQILGNVTARFPSLGVIMLCPNPSPERLLEVMRVGVREALPTPPTRDSLLSAINRFQQRIKQASMPVRNGKVLAFIPCKGGSGATFLATNLAYTLAAQNNQRVALIDFNLQLGDASLFLSDSKSPASIADVARQIHRLDGAFLASSMIQITPNLGILAAPDEPEKATEIKPEHVNPILQVAIKNYDFVILDIGRRMDSVSVQALDKADMIFPVMQQTLPFIRDAKRLIDVFRSLGYHKDKLRLVVNRYDKKSQITLDDIQNTLKCEVFKSIPNNFSVVDESVNHGVPVHKLAPRSPIAKAVEDIGNELSQNTEQQQRWFRKLFS
ncbi:pilus assembly protein CpaE [Nitrosomonas oligotropha]|uniref:Pilus assembly protein CpaE n=1 Tax=Nitrosomonas oligotropha TaxID=42354 RepID=A0A2T5H8C9_9PROT|nr:AAA family ATPase [Nitrosomonas oligotropha]PTQ67824.1 pilus assembly protein CpaE [Nitrosomonas oligotropha]